MGVRAALRSALKAAWAAIGNAGTGDYPGDVRTRPPQDAGGANPDVLPSRQKGGLRRRRQYRGDTF